MICVARESAREEGERAGPGAEANDSAGSTDDRGGIHTNVGAESASGEGGTGAKGIDGRSAARKVEDRAGTDADAAAVSEGTAEAQGECAAGDRGCAGVGVGRGEG